MWSELIHIWESHLYANGTVGFQFGVWPTLFTAYAIFRSQPDLGWMRRMQQILGRKHQRNLHVCSTLLRDFAENVCICSSKYINLHCLFAGNLCSSPDFSPKGHNFCLAVVCRQCGMSEFFLFICQLSIICESIDNLNFRCGRKWCTLIDFCNYSDMFLVSSWQYPILCSS